MTAAALLCVGEMLWDVLPDGEYLGGAPLNVAVHAARLGFDARLVSRVGDDERGHRALEAIAALGIDPALVQRDVRYPTGIATARLDASGSAGYAFPTPAA